ncbi:MAG TPA: iron-containing alcohol dehydrogenase, partial [Thermoanaerobaculia bacterium]|nr:iron-containing alcohol dehydrogenase [Thermoanaerobaculia bacterium]
MPFRLPTRTVLAPGCAARLPEIAASYAPRKVLLVTDRGFRATGIPERLICDLAASSLAVFTFDEIEANPRSTTVDRLAEWARSERVALVVGLGGGSVLD